MKKILFITATDNKLNNGNILCEIHRLKLLEKEGEITYLSLGSNKKNTAAFLFNNELENIKILEPKFFCIIRWIYRINYIINVILCNKWKLYKNHYFFRLPFYKSIFSTFDIIFSFYIFPSLALSLFKNKNYCLLIDTNDILTNRHELIGFRKWISVSGKDELLMSNENVIPISISDNDDSHYQSFLKKETFKLYFNDPRTNHLNISSNNNKLHKEKIGILASNSPLNQRDLRELWNIMNDQIIFKELIPMIKIGGSIISYAKKLAVNPNNLFIEDSDFINKFYQDIKVLIVPNGRSSGIKTKILEALNHRVYIITTQFGNDTSLNSFQDFIHVIKHPINSKELKKAIDTFFTEKESINPVSLESSLNNYNSIIKLQIKNILEKQELISSKKS